MMSFPVPTRGSARTLLLTMWQVVVGGVRVFAWDSLREGVIDVTPLPRAARLITLVGLVLVAFFLASIWFSDALRTSGTLEALPLESSAARGVFVPNVAVPLSLTALTFAWSFLLAGALRVRAWARWATLLGFVLFGLAGLISGSVPLLQSVNATAAALSAVVGLGALVLLILAFLVLPRFRLPLALEVSLIFVLVGALFIVNLLAAAITSTAGSVDFITGYLTPNAVTGPRILILPLLYIAGSEMGNFALTASGWATQSAKKYAPAGVLVFLLLALLAYRLGDLLINTILPGVSQEQWLKWGGAALTAVALVPIALWRHRQPPGGKLPGRLIVFLVIGLLAFQISLPVVVNVFTAMMFLVSSESGNLEQYAEVARQIVGLSEAYSQLYYLIAAVAGVVIAGAALWRKNYTVAAFGMVLAWTQTIWWLMENGRPLEMLRYSVSEMDVILLLGLVALTLYWLVRRQLTTSRALRLFGLAFLVWILTNTDFLDNPFSLLFGFTGVFFIVFGILWGVLTAGGRFANTDSPSFPRVSRILMYLGYVLMTVTISHWFVVTHNVAEQNFQASLTMGGFRLLGLTIVYIAVVEGGAALVQEKQG